MGFEDLTTAWLDDTLNTDDIPYVVLHRRLDLCLYKLFRLLPAPETFIPPLDLFLGDTFALDDGLLFFLHIPLLSLPIPES